MPILYDYDERTITYARRKVRKFSSSPGFWTGFGIASILWLIAIPILAEPIAIALRKKV